MSKLSFRARALDATKPMPIYMAEELPDLPDYSAINRAVPQMPSGMNKEEECEHHLQRAICAGLIIPTPEVSDIPDKDLYDLLYPANYKQPRQLIHMQPFTMEQDIPDYDMDSDDERWLQSQAQRLELDPLKFEEMMDRLEKSSGQTVVTLNEAKALLKEDDDLIIAVFDYWLNKRLKTQHPLILTVKTEQRAGTAANNPYLAFRRRTEKMQTRKNRKNDEASYEKMLKLRRDLHRAVTLLELVKKREKMKREHVHLTVEIFEKRYHAKDFSGSMYAEAAAIKTRPAFTPIFHNHYTNQSWTNKAIMKDDVIPRKEKRQYKKRKHKSLSHLRGVIDGLAGSVSSDEDRASQLSPEPEEVEDEGQFAFRRNKLCSYHMPLSEEGNWPWTSREDNGWGDKRFRFTLASLSHPRRRCVGFTRRRIGRGGRVILDRIGTEHDDLWRTLDFSIIEPKRETKSSLTQENDDSDVFTSIVNNNINNSDLVSDYSTLITRTDIKSESGHYDDSNVDVRTTSSNSSSTIKSDVIGSEMTGTTTSATTEVKSEVKLEPNDEEEEDMVEVLRSVRRDWLHFRPKTPPPDWESPCELLPLSESYLVPGNSSPFSVEIQSLFSEPSTLLDSGVFITDPFNFEDAEEVPITDTRQQQSSDKTVQTGINSNVNAGLNTLTSSVNNSISFNDIYNNIVDNNDASDDGDSVGCSKFHLYDSSSSSGCLDTTKSKKNTAHSGTHTAFIGTQQQELMTTTTDGSVTRFRHNSNCNAVSSLAISGIPMTTTSTTMVTQHQKNDQAALANTNGILSTLGVKNNKITYAYGSPTGTLSLHTSARTLTLNSHSANILEIPLAADESEPVVATKLVNSQCTNESGGPGTPNNKNKTSSMVRKNNIVMEVT